MAKSFVVSDKNFIRFLEYTEFSVVRINGSHHRLKYPDGRVTTIPVHKNEDLSKGLLRKIIKEDLNLTQEEFEELWNDWK